jgi:hypothetical protein
MVPGRQPHVTTPCASPICYRPARLGYVSVRNGAVVQAWLKRRSYGRIDAARAEVWGQAARSAIASMPGSRTGSGRNEPSSRAASRLPGNLGTPAARPVYPAVASPLQPVSASWVPGDPAEPGARIAHPRLSARQASRARSYRTTFDDAGWARHAARIPVLRTFPHNTKPHRPHQHR